MKESLKSFLNRCRCCLESFEEDEKYSPITEFFAIQFYALTRLELETNDLLSNHVCEFCHSELLRFTVFKKSLVEKQSKLYDLLKELETEEESEEIINQYSDEEYIDDIQENNINKQIEYDEIDILGSISENYTDSSECELEESEEEDSSSNATPKEVDCEQISNLTAPEEEDLLVMTKSPIYQSDINETNTGSDLEETRSETTSKEKNNLDSTSNEASNRDIFRYRCMICGMTFKTKLGVTMHRYKKHGTVKKCNYGCKKSFIRNDKWIHHVRNFHPFYEEECLKMISLSRTKKWFTEIRHDDPNIEDLYCVKCSYYANDKKELVSHLEQNHSDKRGQKCPLCSRYLISSHTLSHHIRTIHNNTSGYQCNMCSEVFKQVSQVKEHMKNTHDAIYQPFTCNECKASFDRTSCLVEHLVNFHKNKQLANLIEKSEINKRVCICNKKFRYQGGLQEHQLNCKIFKEHSQIPRFHCDVCSRGFTLKNSLSRHKKKFNHF